MTRRNKNQSGTPNNISPKGDLYFDLFKNYPHPMWIYDTDTLKFIDVNDAAVINYGYSKDEFLSLTLKDIRPLEDIPSLLQDIRTKHSVIQRDRSFRHKKKDGTIINVEISSHQLPSKNNENYRLVMAIDITEQYRAEKLLKESEGRLRSTLDGMLEGCQIIGFDWRYIYLNKTAELHNHRPNDELIGNKYIDMWPEIEKTVVFNRIKDCLENGTPHNLENEFTYPDGAKSWFDLRIQPVPDGVFILSIDITERKQAEEKLKETYSLIKIATEKAKLGGWNVILEETRSYWSDEVAAIHEMPAGYHPMLEDGINFYAPEWRDKITKVFTECAQKGIPYDEEMEIITASGNRKWVRTIGEPVRDESGKIFKVQGAFQDITERKRTEEALRHSEYQYRTLFENMNAGFVLFEVVQNEKGVPADLIIIAANEGFEKTTGLNLKNAIGKHLTDALPGIEKDDADWIGTYSEVALTGESIQFEQGSELLGSYYSVSAYKAGPKQCAVTFVDITERKLAEKALRHSEERLRLSTELANVAVWEYDFNANSMSRSKNHDKLYGLDWQTHWDLNTFTNATHPDDREYSNNIIQSAVAAGGDDSYSFDFRVVYPDHSIHWLNVVGQVTERDSNGIGKIVRGCLIDITERKNLEQEIIASRDQLENVLNSITDAFITLDHDYRITYINPEAARINKKQPDEFIGKTHWEEWPASVGTIVEKQYRKAMNEKVTVHFEHNYYIKDQYDVWLDIHAYPTDDGIAILYSDITAQKLAEEKIHKISSQLEAALSSMTDAVFISDADGRFIHFNDAFATFHKFKDKEECATTLQEYHDFLDVYFTDGNLAPHDQWAVPRALRGESAVNEEYILQRKDTGETWVGSYSFAPIYDNNNNIVGSVVTARDITELKKINDALRESKEIAEKNAKAKSVLFDRLNEAQNTAKIGSWDLDLITGEVWWSDELYNIFEVDPKYYVPSVEANAKFVHPDDNVPYHNEVKRIIESGEMLNFDLRIITPKGNLKYCNSKAKIYYDDQNKPIRLSGTFMDITDRKNSEVKLKLLMNRLIESEESFRKKASQQLHDEVGQNLTALTINLNYLLSQLDANTYNKAYNRLKDSLSILDNTVEQIRNIMVELRPSVLDDYGLFAALKWSAAKFKDRTNINVQVLGKELSERLPINIEYAIFRSVQEIFHNIAKHAQAANVFVNFEESKSKVILQISDDGIGFDASVVIKSSDNSSFGLQSISERMELIGAKINIDSYPGKGTSVLIEIER